MKKEWIFWYLFCVVMGVILGSAIQLTPGRCSKVESRTVYMPVENAGGGYVLVPVEADVCVERSSK